MNLHQRPEQLAAMQADKQLEAMEQNGLIVIQGTDYVIEVSLEQGKFIVNGKPFEPAMMKLICIVVWMG